jgi:hypothetical protein
MNDNNIQEILEDSEALKNLKELVLARIQVMPDTLSLAVGSQDLSKEELIAHVTNQDALGTQIMEMELEFLQDVTSGAIYQYE